MVAEKLDQLDVAEARLKRLIELTPENAQALNALGYTLVDRTPRTEEGYALIEKALKLSPDDPFIHGQHGLGAVPDGQARRRGGLPAPRDDRSAPTRRSPRISARCCGPRATATTAQDVWQSQLKSTPDNAMLLDTVRRLAP